MIGTCCTLLLLGFGCQPKPPQQQLLHQQLLDNQLSGQDTVRRKLLAETAAAAPLVADLSGPFLVYAAEHAYETLHYEDALEMGRHAFWSLTAESSDEQLPALYRAASLLCKLHYEYWNHTDSIAFYQGLAREFRRELPESEALDLDLALLEAMKLRINYNWPVIEDLVDSVRADPSYARLELADTKAQLSLLLALSLRKQRGDVRSEAELMQLFARSRQANEEAIAEYGQFASPRIGQALEDFALYQAVLGSDEEFAAACAALDASQNPAYPERYGFTARLKGFRISQRDAVAALAYYQEVYPRIPAFNTLLTDETNYFLEEVAKQQKDHQQLWRLAAAAVQNGRCARLGAIAPAQLTEQLPNTTVCNNVLIDLTVAKVIEYQQTRNEEALALANHYSDYLLRHWTSDQTGTTDKALLYQFDGWGAEGLDAAIVAAFENWKTKPGRAEALALFQRMDAAKALLLRRESAKRDEKLGLPRHVLRDSLIGLEQQIGILTAAGEAAGPRFAAQVAPRRAVLSAAHATLSKRLGELGAADNTGLLLKTDLPAAAQLGQENVLAFSWTKSGVFAVAVNEREAIAYQIEADGLEEEIASFRSLLQNIRPGSGEIASYHELAHRLYQRLLLPADALLAINKPLLILPDGPLSGLPFEALLTEKKPATAVGAQSPFFLRRHPIRYAPSWAVDRIDTGRNVYLAEESDIGLVAHSLLKTYFQATHDTLRARGRRYVEHVGKADRNTLQRLVEGANIVHFSTHAKGNPDRLQDNYIFLSPQDSINASLIEDLDLRGKLIVLAACETQVGQQRFGEGTFSISRSFRLAGAGHVISSLWQVKGKATQELLLEFYRQLFDGHSPAEALWRAKMKLATGQGTEGYWWPGAWGGVVG
ncbi:CHAT domain-containing protein [Neolewinella lacunae]|uniref:CHAT domain-containing protein n=1 Tax=Neolewinella lacunae TaxID=1517758 RepID=A0A923PLY4_9BACT|nr:CHAT domain-containing protein [Neolewinella lacunae]MBC6992947.1 CHAT domain-containing protein [Neolewinella lacunae]MDN3633689.1 CHAT domain-containing protein [Neolewinella lacunae]